MLSFFFRTGPTRGTILSCIVFIFLTWAVVPDLFYGTTYYFYMSPPDGCMPASAAADVAAAAGGGGGGHWWEDWLAPVVIGNATSVVQCDCQAPGCIPSNQTCAALNGGVGCAYADQLGVRFCKTTNKQQQTNQRRRLLTYRVNTEYSTTLQ